jgi:anti-sigma B factor antagonist
MQLKQETVGEVRVVNLEEKSLEAMNSREFKEDMAPIIDGCKQLVLDLGLVDFVDSSGCGALLSCLRQINANDGEMKICNVQRPVQTLFELVRMHRIMDIMDTREQALDAFA